MTIISRDAWRAAELHRLAMESEMVPSALLLEALKAYTDLKERTDAATAIAAQQRQFEQLMLGAWLGLGHGRMTAVQAFGSAYVWPGDPDDVCMLIRQLDLPCSFRIKQSADGSYGETMVVVGEPAQDERG